MRGCRHEGRTPREVACHCVLEEVTRRHVALKAEQEGEKRLGKRGRTEAAYGIFGGDGARAAIGGCATAASGASGIGVNGAAGSLGVTVDCNGEYGGGGGDDGTEPEVVRRRRRRRPWCGGDEWSDDESEEENDDELDVKSSGAPAVSRHAPRLDMEPPAAMRGREGKGGDESGKGGVQDRTLSEQNKKEGLGNT